MSNQSLSTYKPNLLGGLSFSLLFLGVAAFTLAACEPFHADGNFQLQMQKQQQVEATYADGKGLPLRGQASVLDDVRVKGTIPMVVGSYAPATRLMSDVRLMDPSDNSKFIVSLPEVSLNDQHVSTAIVSRVTALVPGFPGCRLTGETKIKFVFLDSSHVDVVLTQSASYDTVNVNELACSDLMKQVSEDITNGKSASEPFSLAQRAGVLDMSRLQDLRKIEIIMIGSGARN